VKNSYTLTVKVADRTVLADLLDAVQSYAESVEIAISNNAPKTVDGSSVAKTKTVKRGRGPKRSKVNDTIRNALAKGAGKISELKESLINAGMSAASLSTGIAALTKAGEIERVGDGEYALKAA
jgi:hypothetical protein